MSVEKSNRQMNIASIVLAGGKGTRLFPLTQSHCKPAIRYGGKYRLIDIPISNSLNSNIRQIYVIGQYLTAELQHHIAQSYQFDYFSPGSIDFLTPGEYPDGQRVWFEGTADAIRKNLHTILKAPVDYFLILSGDQLYNINFRKMFQFTIEKDADLTIASIPVKEIEAKRLGLLKTDDHCMIKDFFEKPQEAKVLSRFRLEPSFYQKNHRQIPEYPEYLASMGIYIFKRNALKNLLEEDLREDFGKHLIPTQILKGKTASFLYDGYWEDIGTVESFYHANLALIDSPNKGLEIYDEENPIFGCIHYLPGPKIFNATVKNSIISEGSIIHAKEISNSVIGLRSHIKKESVLKDSIVMGNNFYISPSDQTHMLPEHFEIGENCLIEKTIIDEHVCIGNGVKLINKQKLQTYDSQNLYVRDGIIVITAGTSIPNGFEF
jgi:glucose-1-phosphate adenylyltransferase